MRSRHILAFALTLLIGVCQSFAQSTVFTYQGRLNNGGAPANGSFDLTFSLFNSTNGPGQLGTSFTNTATPVTNGLFTVALDFGSVFDGSGRWLEIAVRTNGGGVFVTLMPRQPLTAAPYAMTAANVTGTIGSSQIAPGAVGNPQLGLCKISGFVNCNNTDPTHTFVYVRGTSSLAYVGDSTANGYPYQLTLLEPGTYTVVARTSGGFEVSSPVTVAAGQTVANVNFAGVNLLADTNNCGTCGNVCNFANASPACVGGGCQIAACNPGFANCDGNPANGCEIHTAVDPNNCGNCGQQCVVPNGTAGCANSLCTVAGCNPGFTDCNGNPADGCEIHTTVDVNNCGTCGHVCIVANGTPGCASSACIVAGCNAGFTDCNGNPADGCEIHTTVDVNNCGTCGHACAVANGTPGCASGACTVAGCNAGFANCNGIVADGCEIHTAVDPNNCGGCGTKCSAANGTAGCANGACTVASCNAGFGDCDGNAANGCEMNLSNNLSNCGFCGNACSLTAHATAMACVSSFCRVASCSTGFADCDLVAANGCEINTTTDANNCGTCGHKCVTGHSCVNSVCN